MARQFTNRQLAECFRVPLDRVKRWSREFLPPDPTAGRQCGRARTYDLDEAFTLYLAGYLVSELHFSIPDTRIILSDLGTWLLNHGLYPSTMERPKRGIYKHVKAYDILIVKPVNSRVHGYLYYVKSIISLEQVKMQAGSEEYPVLKEVYFLDNISYPTYEVGSTVLDLQTGNYWLLKIDRILQQFIQVMA